MAQRLSQEAKGFWDMVIGEIMESERLKEFPWFLRRLLIRIRDKDGEFFKKILREVRWLGEGYRLPSKVLDWMEAAISCKPSIKPMVVADQACSIFKINPLMRNLLIKEARKIKKRVVMRKRRSWAKEAYLIKLIGENVRDCEECPILRVLGLEKI